jgi:DNA primase
VSRFTHDSVERVKEATDVVEVISAYTDLRRSGARFTGLCPFHDERTPSFSVDPQEKLYHCFGCGVGGDVIRFVEEKEGLPFADAVESLADRYGVELEREQEDPRAEEQRRKRARLSELLERTAAFYAAFLREAPQAARARDYLAERGLGDEVLAEFGVGCAPGTWDTVLVRGQKAGYSVAEIEAAGLILKSQKGRGHYDRFRSRIVFPIRDARGRVQGFGARALLADQKPKYVNSPESRTFKKRASLYGVDRARPTMAKSRRAVVVEGYTDVLACHQAGITDAVAIMGTAITQEQLKELGKHAEGAILALDADRAGREAMLRAQGVTGGDRLRLRVVRMPGGKDPADLLALGDESSPSEFSELVGSAEDLAGFHVRTVLDEAETSSPQGRDQALREVAPIISSIGDSIEAQELQARVTHQLDVAPELVTRRINQAGGLRTSVSDVDASEAEAPRRFQGLRERREIALLAMCVRSPAEGQAYVAKLTDEHFSSPVAGRARAWLGDHLEDPMRGLPRDDEELITYVTQVKMRSEREPASAEAMDLNYLELDRARIEDQIAAAEANGADPPVELQRARAELTERIARAHS